MKNIDKKYVIWGLGVLILLSALYFLTAVLLPRAMVTLTKAAPAKKVAFNNSYMLGSKLLARADGEDSNKVNIFVLDDRSQGVADKAVTIEGLEAEGGNITKTDNAGMASFEFKSETEGVFELKASIEGVELPKSLKITFRNN